jgi:hypothetical protein
MSIELDVGPASKCPLWVKSRHMRRNKACPLYPNSDRESGLPHTVMSALPLKADVCDAIAHVCYGPIADITYSISSSARASSEGGIVIPSALAVLRLMTISKVVGWTTGRSAGFSPLRMRPT